MYMPGYIRMNTSPSYTSFKYPSMLLVRVGRVPIMIMPNYKLVGLKLTRRQVWAHPKPRWIARDLPLWKSWVTGHLKSDSSKSGRQPDRDIICGSDRTSCGYSQGNRRTRWNADMTTNNADRIRQNLGETIFSRIMGIKVARVVRSEIISNDMVGLGIVWNHSSPGASAAVKRLSHGRRMNGTNHSSGAFQAPAVGRFWRPVVNEMVHCNLELIMSIFFGGGPFGGQKQIALEPAPVICLLCLGLVRVRNCKMSSVVKHEPHWR